MLAGPGRGLSALSGPDGFQSQSMDWTCELFFDNIMHHSVGLDPGEIGKERAGNANPEMAFPFRTSMLVAYVKV